ncbi:GNAT family N-acetyltransferase [Nannocystis pusilla]|uniref:GNAT family N-acetyltransferase n=1 Tax=Nannocystis pusilla TaxID=889268 RepID=A0A9X3EPR5_9BACT|nr:GNAT family N-acetyltransferase [Nannocystis pusilla]MCY1006975.1 GNAT family N-acetyltransferase [Nannocystis pusilla]
MSASEFQVRPASCDDAAAIAEAHVDAIRSLGSSAYAHEVVADWASPRTGERYVQAMRQGEQFFVAVDADAQVVGFAAHRVEAGDHRVAVYVRGRASRRGVGSSLFAAAEAVARARGASEIRVDASLVAVPFYAARGFVSEGPAMHTLRSGRAMACVKMRKPLT